jgi:hypothetical protein
MFFFQGMEGDIGDQGVEGDIGPIGKYCLMQRIGNMTSSISFRAKG